VAEYLGADSVSIPISANDAVDAQLAKRGIKATKTKIGSPNVIEAMEHARAGGQCECVVGWEANGGFLTGSAIEKNGRKIAALPTRDAALPLLAALYYSAEQNCSLIDLFAQLPPRFSKAGLIDQFPQEASRAIVQRFSPLEPDVKQVDFDGDSVRLAFEAGHDEPASQATAAQQLAIRREVRTFFTDQLGFDDIVRINTIDGVRVYFRNGDIAHIRPSGNAPQLRIYAVADSQQRADEIVREGISEPNGVLRKMEAAVKGSVTE
jgi:phosphomannomutase